MKKLLFLLCLITASCSYNSTEDQYYVFDEETWNSDSIVQFSISCKDSTDLHKLTLNVRHTTDYKFQNLYLFTHFLGVLDTVELIISEKNGKWKGRGIGDAREISLVLKKEFYFEKNGDYSLTLEQAMRYGDKNKISKLKGLIAVGLSVEKINE
tara:strand:- start:358 stop:819 length:462 start_codon:yes stop_codon:yes gene_type:complete